VTPQRRLPEDEGEKDVPGCRRRLPLCMNLLEDARRAMGAEDLAIRDVAEIVADGLVAG